MSRLLASAILAATGVMLGCAAQQQRCALERIVVSADGRGFATRETRRAFVPWGFNYDHDADGRLLEDYWESEWPAVVEDFGEMRALGANVVRIHLQFGRFMRGPQDPRAESLARLRRLVALAEETGLYLDLTGLGCYRKRDVPAWYDALAEVDRWAAQARFWEAVAESCAESPAIFCYDLMNEPVVAGAARASGDWLGPPFAGEYHYVQFITLDPAGRERAAIAAEWIQTLRAAIRRKDEQTLITVGLVEWSLDRPGLTSGFVPRAIAPQVDFLSVHLYPAAAKVDEALATLRGFAVGKPVVIEETFPLNCSFDEMRAFLRRSKEHASGWMSFYWGRRPEEYRRSGALGDAIVAAWIDAFAAEGRARAHAASD